MTGVPARSSASRDRVRAAGAQRERDVMQPLGRSLDQTYLLLVATGAPGDQ
jgi:hypothetical protein